MIPIKLTLQGIQSYRERQEIDFGQLTEAGLFGVFGKVGSGKSTILEAITFCLFGDTERLNNRENRSYNLMNLRSDRLYLDFEFRTGREQTTYRFVVEGKRNGKQFDKVTLDRKAYQWMAELNDWSPIATENPAERIIGLSYENFKRTVIIPQGRFQEFIELRDADRTRMMKELFRLERFELADRTKILNDSNNNALASVEGELKGLGEVTPEILAQTRLDLQNTHQLLLIEKGHLHKKREEEKAIETLKKLFDRLMEADELLQKLKIQEEDFKTKKLKLNQYEEFVQVFKPLYEDLTKLTARQYAENLILTQKNNAYETLQQQLTAHQTQLDTLRPAYEKQQETRTKIVDLQILAQIKTLEAEKAKLEERVKDGEEKLVVKKLALVARQQDLQKSKEGLHQLRQNLPDMAQLAEVRKWFDTKEQLQKEREKLKTDANAFVEKQQHIDHQKQGLFTESITPWLVPTIAQENYSSIFEAIEIAQNKLLSEAESLNTKLLHLQTQRALQQYAGALNEGEPCPLCGAVHHPEVLKADDDWDTHIKGLQKQQEQLRKTANSTLSALTNKLTGLQKEWELIEGLKKKLKTEDWPQKTIEINEHEQRFVWKTFDASQREGVDKLWDDAEALQKKRTDLEKEIEKEEKEINSEENVLKTKFEEPLTKLRESILAKSGAIDNANSQVKNLKIVDYKDITLEKINQNAQKLEADLVAVVKDFEALDKIIREQNLQKSTLEGEIKSIQVNLHSIVADQKITQEKLENTLDQQQTSDNDVKAVLAWNLAIQKERNEIQVFETNLFATKKECESLQEATAGKTLNAEHYRELLSEIEKHEAEQSRLSREIGKLTEEEKVQSRQIDQQAALLAKKRALEIRKTDLDTMAKLFRSSGFVNYVSSVYLQNLCNQANQRFHRMTRQQLQLEISDTNNFQVRDLLNDGKLRALNTLSGGQKFQAALALSLALADNIHAQTQAKENFFFLDEGFGSLDKESLQTVFDTLKSLRKENRIVGVISHVEDLQQEIDCYLRITNEDERGSLVKFM